jgi:hypothetical protein
MILTEENGRTQRKTCPSALSTTNPTLTDLGVNPDRLRGEKPATNHLSYGTTRIIHNLKTMQSGKYLTLKKEFILYIQNIGGESSGKCPLGRPRRRLEDNTEMGSLGGILTEDGRRM